MEGKQDAHLLLQCQPLAVLASLRVLAALELAPLELWHGLAASCSFRLLGQLHTTDKRGQLHTTMMMTFITQMGESQGKTKKERKATKSKGRGLEEGG